ncbi:hypothetical protein EJ08DRAFT_703483 [Tothia fuscella]|uniref:Uncharacterized protein n=1 Tax=Tothia fuscella TaxID=1048955 RepID=A0A9P4NE87_9PEZI|nr:hypothetical protein EJ08DRAFT_703483 [Tothia fuscella]
MDKPSSSAIVPSKNMKPKCSYSKGAREKSQNLLHLHLNDIGECDDGDTESYDVYVERKEIRSDGKNSNDEKIAVDVEDDDEDEDSDKDEKDVGDEAPSKKRRID